MAYLTTGCSAAMVHTRVAELDDDIPREATAIALRSAIDAMDDPTTQKRIQRMVGRPETRAAQQAMIGGLVDATFASLAEPERSEKIGGFAAQAMSHMLAGASRELPGLVDGVTREAVGGALDSALDPARQERLEGAVAALMATGVRSAAEGLREAEIGKALSDAMTHELGPAFHDTMRDDVAPGFAAMMENERFQRALGQTARVLGREMVAGASDAIAERNRADGGPGISLPGLVKNGARLFDSAAWVLVLVIVLLSAWIGKLVMQARRYRDEVGRRAAMSRLLQETAKACEGKPWAPEVWSALRERLAAEESEIAEARRAPRWRLRRPPRERTA